MCIGLAEFCIRRIKCVVSRQSTVADGLNLLLEGRFWSRGVKYVMGRQRGIRYVVESERYVGDPIRALEQAAFCSRRVNGLADQLSFVVGGQIVWWGN